MKRILGSNISRYRKEQGLTQQELAKLLNISYQAVSKWENGQTAPDLYLLPHIAEVLKISVDRLIGCPHTFNNENNIENDYEKRYNTEEYYWGVKPSRMCLKILELMPPIQPLRLLDIGCGEGKDAVFFARCGYMVSAFDVTDSGIEKTKRLAEKAGVQVDAFKANLLDFRLERDFDILYSSGVFHFVKPGIRGEIFDNYKLHTRENGINAFNVFVEKPFVPAPPDKDSLRYNWKSGELMMMYHDWYIEECLEEVFDCNSGGTAHRHAMDTVYARKV